MTGKASRNRFGWLSEEEDSGVEEVRKEEGAAPARLPVIAPRRRRNRPKNPEALRNDPRRMMAGARIRRDVRRRVDQALADPAVVGDGGMNYSLLVESLLVRWLEEVGYSLEER